MSYNYNKIFIRRRLEVLQGLIWLMSINGVFLIQGNLGRLDSLFFTFFPLILCTDIYLWGATYGSSPPYMTLRRSLQRPLEAVNDTNSMIEITFWKINTIILFRGVKYVGKVFFQNEFDDWMLMQWLSMLPRPLEAPRHFLVSPPT